MGMITERLNIRLFIDGIEAPVIGVNCVFAEGTVATAVVNLVATDEIYDIKPRAFITIFVYDGYDFVPDHKSGGGATLGIGPQDLRRYKLLFAGEMVAISVNKSAAGRSATMQCACPTNYWDFIKQQYINFRNGGVELFESAFLGVKQDRLKFFDVVTAGAHSKMYVWLTQSRNANGKASLFLGVQRMLREMFFSVSDFYGEAFNRLRLGDQIVGLAADETAAELFKIQFAEKFMKNRVGGAGGMTTARQMIDLLLGPVFHSYVTVPFPKFDRTGASGGLQLDPAKKADKALLDPQISREKSWKDASLNYTVIKPDTWFMTPPACNIVFPHMYRTMSYSRNYLSEPTRMFLRTSLIFTGQDLWLTERFYAPDFDAFNDQLYKKGGYLNRLAETLLPHEEFVGLNPIQVWNPDLTAFVAKGPRREYLARMTDYLFWKYRFGSRQTSVSGPLNLNLVPGYPGVVLDRVSSATTSPKHYVGNIASVVHSIDQQGGQTHFTLVGSRTHDEVIDFDGKNRTLEEITSRGTDGFLDNRYDIERIGEEVYQHLFGCGSVYDVFNSLDIEAENEVADSVFSEVAELFSTAGPMVASVKTLEILYKAAVDNDVDMRSFTSSITQRPKANFVEMMGSDVGLPTSSDELNSLAATDPDAFEQEGFFVAAVDPTADTTVNSDYTTTKGKTAKYKLKEHLKARQEKVQAYVNSLRLRGLRG